MRNKGVKYLALVFGKFKSLGTLYWFYGIYETIHQSDVVEFQMQKSREIFIKEKTAFYELFKLNMS